MTLHIFMYIGKKITDEVAILVEKLTIPCVKLLFMIYVRLFGKIILMLETLSGSSLILKTINIKNCVFVKKVVICNANT